MNWFERLLKTYGYESLAHVGESLAPSLKYAGFTTGSTMLSAFAVSVDRIFGLDAYAFFAFLIVLLTELISGITASRIRKEELSSMKFSRFLFKVFYYLVLIAVPYLFSASFKFHSKDMAAIVFDWMHVFLVIQIVLENMISILENMAVISGKPKTHIINKLTEKIENLIK
ncbi:phage holin family protein [Olivibacter sp. 47]|uniref:phage holin family protein n=1 Tax=Olivibacter sp. 47 TaxID=3056486 RepID=UPI0025A42268|nr:phage holin family protein [Olivibacter sp. 47]MDM8176849.1 phage holin family protein [Olivibacter sp. 47]